MPPELAVATVAAVAAVVVAHRDLLDGWLDKARRTRDQVVRQRQLWSRIFFWFTFSSLALTIAGISASVLDTPKLLSVTLACLAAIASILVLLFRPDTRIASLGKNLVDEEAWEMILEAAKAELADDEMNPQAARSLIARLIEHR